MLKKILTDKINGTKKMLIKVEKTYESFTFNL